MEQTKLLHDEDITQTAAWRRKRFTATVICMIYQFWFGIEYTGIVISSLYYLKDDFNPRFADFRYSVIMAVIPLVGYISGLVGKYVDRTKNLKMVMIVLLLISALGNLMYSCYYSVWFLIIGRLLSGSAICMRSIIAGEFARWWKNDPKSCQKVLLYYENCFVFGFTCGPASVIFFKYVDFTIFNFHVNKDNFIGVLLFCALICTLIATCFGVHDLSKDISTVKSEQPLLELKHIIKDCDVVMILLCNGFQFFASCSGDLLVTLIGRNRLGLSSQQIGICMLISSFLILFFMATVWEKYFLGINAMKGMVFCMFCLSHAYAMLLFAYFITVNNVIFNCALLVLVTFLISAGGFGGEVAAREILFQIVPINSASYIEGIRNIVALCVFAGIGFFTASFIYDGIAYIIPLLMIVLLLSTIPLYKRSLGIYRRGDLAKLQQ